MSLKPPVSAKPPATLLKRPTMPAAAPAATKAITVKATPTPGAALTKYVPPDLNALRTEKKQIAEDRAAARKSGDKYKLEVGKNNVRICPGRGVPNPFHVTWIHYIRNPSKPDGFGRPVVCPLKTRKQPCIICAREQALKREGTDMAKHVASDIRASRRIYANVINMNEKEKRVQVWDFGVRLYEELLSLMVGDESNPEEFPGVDYTHPEHGHTLLIEKECTDPNNPKETTTYSKPKESKNTSAIPIADWLSKLNDLTKVVEAITDEKIEAILEGREEEAEDAVPANAPSVEDDVYTT